MSVLKPLTKFDILFQHQERVYALFFYEDVLEVRFSIDAYT